MTWLRGVLDDIAGEAPRVDLAEEALRMHERRRRTSAALIAAATVVVVVVGATATVRLLPVETERPAAPNKPEKVSELPAKGVGPLSHAYRTFCHPVSGKTPDDCRDGRWRVVTQDGQTYHLSAAAGNGTVAITTDGRKIAYYLTKSRTFQVRDLASGAETVAPVRIPPAWLGSVPRLLLSDDGRFLAFTKKPALDDPAMLIDLREQMTRPLPNGWVPVGLSADGSAITLMDYSPKSRLRTMTRLWTTATAGNSSTVDIRGSYLLGPPAPGRTMIAALENRLTMTDSCVPAPLVQFDVTTGKVLRKVALRGVPMNTHRVFLRGWLSPTEITAVAMPLPACTKPGPDVPNDDIGPSEDPPYQTITSYAVDVQTGKARKLPATYSAQGTFDLVLPGPPGSI
ncbi:hypothetical protein Acor_71890 [Acrocarpospora corrugata]|uniref:Lipoprotein LpqB beta-propeller domain-containing protein n=1 Tax=Acrocarpospora corrugata TaxID=35763 RepID=A0A5M3WDG1_9ACTN|nr:hypothetical protein [Acrocarpospora corrugata]GES05121.1 hypothetical protein Acor_71890 [Acrocarpospora corrugata]